MEKLDVLNREGFIEQLLCLVENISSNKSTTSFAINGSWGCGKSFVLDMFEEKLSKYQSEETATEKYFIIRYNCWKYDYYEEPLLAIVAAILDTIDERKNIVSAKTKEKVKSIAKIAAQGLIEKANEFAKEKTGINTKAIYDVVTKGLEKAEESIEEEYSYDLYFSFKKTLSNLRKAVASLAEESTIVLIVDELDRCLPEYTIKVLERLHHVFNGIPNIQVAIAVDKEQLGHTIQTIYGESTSIEKYLAKFIDFEIELDCGTVSERISEKHADYISLFDKSIFEFPESIEEFMGELFRNVDARTQEHIFKKAILVHNLLFTEKKDYSFMCMELLLAVLICIYNDESCFNGGTIVDINFERIFAASRRGGEPAFAKAFANHLISLNFSRYQAFSSDPVYYYLPEQPSLYAAIVFSWYWLHKEHHKLVFQHRKGDAYDVIANNHIELRRFAETIKIIK